MIQGTFIEDYTVPTICVKYKRNKSVAPPPTTAFSLALLWKKGLYRYKRSCIEIKADAVSPPPCSRVTTFTSLTLHGTRTSSIGLLKEKK